VARHIRNPKIESRAARAKLKPSGRPTYFDLGGKLHLGYRKGERKGVWVMRVYLGGERYATETIGEADDLADANGATVFSFHQAQERARERMKALDAKRLGTGVTVGEAVAKYIDERLLRDPISDVRSKLKRVLANETLSRLPLAALTGDDLTRWREGLGGTMAPVSKRRIASDLKAALNSAGRRLRSTLPPTFRDAVKDGLAFGRAAAPVARDKQIIADADVRRLISAAWKVDGDEGWSGDLGRMILTLAATGARFGQIARLRVADFQAAEKRLMIPVSRKGGGEKQQTHIAVPLGEDVLNVLKAATAGRRGHDVLFLRPRWRRVPGQPGQGGFGVLEIYARSPWRAASELTPAWRRVVAHAGLPASTVPYALRHSSIVRSIRNGVPMRLAAALHDTSSAMIEAHYSRFITDALDELARRAVVPLMPEPVTPLRAVEG